MTRMHMAAKERYGNSRYAIAGLSQLLLNGINHA